MTTVEALRPVIRADWGSDTCYPNFSDDWGPDNPGRSADGADWKTSLRQMVLAARGVVLAHPWAPHPIASRTTPGPAMLRYVNTVLGVLRESGFTIAQAHHALHLLGSRALGFTQELFDDSEDDSGELDPETAASLAMTVRKNGEGADASSTEPQKHGTQGRRDADTL